MPALGHDLQFGTFITPLNADPQMPVRLARLSERVGLDLVTFQDHPYQPRFLDAWTLLTWVAARTERIRLAPNVLNLPLRPPAVVARAAVSLDLLSGGRFELALGAGAFWDAIEAMGGRRLEPGESVTALTEAIDVIRAIWTTGDRTPLRAGGEYYRLAGAKRGPAAAHAIPIWVGAQRPRMLRLVARQADGWLTSLGSFPPGGFEAANGILDDAAADAGRGPGEIRRLLNIGGRFADRSGGFLNGPSRQWVEDLLPLALEQGVGTFILASDDAAAIERFAAEVAPALRASVASERATRGQG
ncbi:LLM class flavin-dependent oxidoreductase [Lysobacter korlensis]|uniref:LLM class flavin-dependent oxidoreductase n=1 Tax=Lysobacter korlensis TaxID=553636 RepID=A0ABV6RNI6_9GAMM